MHNLIPKYLLELKHLIELVFFITLFSILFMNVYKPFSDTVWFSISESQNLVVMLFFYIVAVVFLLISKFILFWVKDVIRVTYIKYAIWMIGEIVVISSIYLLFTNSYFIDGQLFSVDLYWKTVFCISMILLIPYTIYTLYAANMDQKRELDRIINGEALHEHERNNDTGKQMINFHDDNGSLKLSINVGSIYYIESQDNYVKIVYKNSDKLVNYMLRCRTKNIENMVKGSTLFRCHRSFIVNETKIKLLHKDNSSINLTLDDDNLRQIPVSKSYAHRVIQRLPRN